VSGTGKTGYFTVRHRTTCKRIVAKLKALQQLWHCRQESIVITGLWLGSIVQGYIHYHAVPGNIRPLGACPWRVIRLWRRQLCLRSQKTRLK
jgi:hypothetical protein